jgi:excisionase family DNA binding protein
MASTKEAPEPTKRLVGVREVAEATGLPVRTIYAAAQREQWPQYRVGRQIRFDLEEILAFVRVRREAG